MQIPRHMAIEKAASRDTARTNLAHPYLDGARLIATNGHMLAVVPIVRDEADTDGPVPAEAFTAARKHPAPGGDAVVIANGDVRVPYAGLSLERPERLTFPDWQRVVPTAPVVFSVGVDVRLLLAVAQAIGADARGSAQVRLDFIADPKADGFQPAALDPIRVSPAGGDAAASGAFGLVMPVRV